MRQGRGGGRGREGGREGAGTEAGLQSGSWVQTPALPPPSIVTLSMGPHTSVLQCPPRKHGMKNTTTSQAERKFQ